MATYPKAESNTAFNTLASILSEHYGAQVDIDTRYQYTQRYHWTRLSTDITCTHTHTHSDTTRHKLVFLKAHFIRTCEGFSS